MNVIVFASRKGGSGKSTLAAHLAAQIKSTKACLLVDADPQGSLTLWHKLRGTNEPPIKSAVNSVSGILAAAKRDGMGRMSHVQSGMTPAQKGARKRPPRRCRKCQIQV